MTIIRLRERHEGVSSAYKLTDGVNDAEVEDTQCDQNNRIQSLLSFLKASQSAY